MSRVAIGARRHSRECRNPASFRRNDTGPPLARGRRSLDEPRVRQRVEIRHLLDDADFEEQVGGLSAELLELAGEELLVRGLILPEEILLRRLELFARLLDV